MISLKYFIKKFQSKNRDDGFSYADFSSRYMSLLFDFFILILILKFISFGFLTVTKFRNQNSEYKKNISSEILYKYKFGLGLMPEEQKFLNSKKKEYFLFQVISFFSLFLYLILSWYYLNGTLGNIMFGFRIFAQDKETEELKKIDLKTCFIRLFGLILVCITLFIGFFSIFFDSKKQGLHDKIAGTVAIKGKNFFNFFDNNKERQNLIRFDPLKKIVNFIKKYNS